MKSQDFLNEIRGLVPADLKQRAGQISEELMKLRFRKASDQNENGARIQLLTKNLSRVLTVIKEKRLAEKTAAKA